MKSILSGEVSVKDENGNCFRVKKDDERYLSGELKNIACGTVVVEDNDGNRFRVSITDERYLSGELKAFSKGKVSVIDKDGNIFKVKKTDIRLLNGDLKKFKPLKGKVTVKDVDGNIFQVSVNDPRFVSGQLKALTKGMCCMKDTDGNVLYVKTDDERIKTGELVSTNKGKLALRNKITGENKLCLKTDPEYFDENWVPCAKGSICVVDKNEKIHYVFDINDPKILSGEYVLSKNLCSIVKIENNKKITKRVRYSVIKKYLLDGWKLFYNKIVVYLVDKNDNIVNIKYIDSIDGEKYIDNLKWTVK